MALIAIDFDGTCVTHEFPLIGSDIGAAKILKELIACDHQLILFTMRSDGDTGTYLADALKWFHDNNIPLYGIQTNPTQHEWTSSPKAYAELYIDDAALGCPIMIDPSKGLRPFVDWEAVRRLLIKRHIILTPQEFSKQEESKL